MQLVIEISDGLYNNLDTIKNGSIASKIILDCVRKGQVIPKGHGDLKDIDAINLYEEDFYEGADYERAIDAIVGAPTIIEADKN